MVLKAFLDGRVFGHRVGSGTPTVLALHGWGRSGADLVDVLEGTSAVALDLPGFGASPPPDEALGATGYASVVAPILEEMADRVVVFGHSFGGRVAVALAAAYPQRIAAMVLCGVPLLRLRAPSQPSFRYRLVRWANRRGFVSDDRMERIRRRRGSADYRAAQGVMRDVLVRVVNETYEEELQALACPVHLLWGADDTEAPVAVAYAARDLLASAGVQVTLEVVPGSGHDLHREHPELVRSRLVSA